MPFVINPNTSNTFAPSTRRTYPALHASRIPGSQSLRPQTVWLQPQNQSGSILHNEQGAERSQRRVTSLTATRPDVGQFYTLTTQPRLLHDRTKEQWSTYHEHEVDTAFGEDKGEPSALNASTPTPNRLAEQSRKHDGQVSLHIREKFESRPPVAVCSDEKVARALRFYDEVFGKGAQGFDPRCLNENPVVAARPAQNHPAVVRERLVSPHAPQREQTTPEPLAPNTPSVLTPRFRARDPVILKRPTSENWGVECCLHFEFTSPSGCRVKVENATGFITPPQGYTLYDIEETPYGDFDMILQDANGELTRMFADEM